MIENAKWKLCDSNNTVLSLLLTNHFIFEGGGWANAKTKISCTAFAEKIEIVHSSIEQRNILQTSEIKFMRRSPKLLVTKKYFCGKNAPPLPPLKNKMVHPFHFSGR